MNESKEKQIFYGRVEEETFAEKKLKARLSDNADLLFTLCAIKLIVIASEPGLVVISTS